MKGIVDEHHDRIYRLSSLCVCLGFFFLILASVLPMWVVASFKGDGKIPALGKDFDVDVSIGDGLWKRNVCYGGDKPDEDVLQKVGLTCKGQRQTSHCSDDNVPDKVQEHCDDFYAIQVTESLSIFFILFSVFLGTLGRSCATTSVARKALRATSIISMFIALCTTGSVISMVKHSDMVHDHHFKCKDVFGADLCYGYGAAFGLQWAAVFALLVTVILYLLLLIVPSDDFRADSHSPLIPNNPV